MKDQVHHIPHNIPQGGLNKKEYKRMIIELERQVKRELVMQTPEERKIKRNLYTRIWQFQQQVKQLKEERRLFLSHYRNHKDMVKHIQQMFNQRIAEVQAKIELIEFEYYAL